VELLTIFMQWGLQSQSLGGLGFASKFFFLISPFLSFRPMSTKYQTASKAPRGGVVTPTLEGQARRREKFFLHSKEKKKIFLFF